ncbi:tyrosine-type recombinase/integrase [Cupriavidus pampae]|uniref:Tyrosine recombinase XerC n=1 Tax=Cupriavidus pampae TaxID=659251 RepID=A0ABM8XVL4_9BURK|nr:site-specific integrase [Cupriavidus pampae]CAG9184435.1 Tyrosine recombinase XerC [Cupriavidus pampae]
MTTEVIPLTPAPPSLDEIAKRGLPVELSGRDGSNRAKNSVRQIEADTDIDAIHTWLAEYPPTSSTFRAYRKEAQRFYCWVIGIAGKPLSSLKREDLDAYRAFITNPPAEWCGRRNARKATGQWKPFEGPLSERSRAYAMTVLEGLFTYLTDVRYLDGNPFKAARYRRKAGPQPGKVPKHFPLHTFERLVSALQSECERLAGQGDAHIEAERMLFVVRFLANTGLRRFELAKARLGDMYPYRDEKAAATYWFLTVVGKGEKTEPVAINQAAVAALERYLRLLGLDRRHSDPATPIVIRLGHQGLQAALSEPLTNDAMYNLVKKALRTAARILEVEHPEDAVLIRKATPHWFRHTFTTLMSQNGHPLPVIQSQLRHASIATTAIYTHAEQNEMYRAVNSLKL